MSHDQLNAQFFSHLTRVFVRAAGLILTLLLSVLLQIPIRSLTSKQLAEKNAAQEQAAQTTGKQIMALRLAFVIIWVASFRIWLFVIK